MSNRDWNRPDLVVPPEGEEIATMNSQGQVQNLIFDNGRWWFPDKSMYVYYVPKFWKALDEVNA